jgi:Putative zinc-finger
MNRHVSTEQLSAYLDQELGVVEVRQLEAHCTLCADCRARLASMRSVIRELGAVRRAAPPAAMRHQIQRQILAAPPSRGFGRAFEGLRLRFFAMQTSLRTAAVTGLVSVFGLFAFTHLGTTTPPLESRPAQEVVTVEAYQDAPVLQTTTSEVAGREFIWTEEGWVQRGLEGKTPEASLDPRSPRGRELLTRYADLAFLIADGSSVVLRYKLETVELRSAVPSRVLGFDSHPGLARGTLAT